MVCRPVTGYLFRLLLCKLGPRAIRHLVWRRGLISVTRYESEELGFVVIHPLTCLNRGLIHGQVVCITVTFQTWQGSNQQSSRLFRLAMSCAAQENSVHMEKMDMFNIFGRIPATNFVVDSIVPYSSLPKICQTLTSADSVKLAPIKQYVEDEDEEKKSMDLEEEMEKLLKTPRIVYNDDVISIHVRNIFTQKVFRHYFKVFCDESPCVVDTTTSVYEIANVNSYLPYAARAQLLEVPEPMAALVDQMRSICLAYEAVRDKPLVMLLSGAHGSGKRLLATRLAVETHRNIIEECSYEIWSENFTEMETNVKNAFEKAKCYQPSILYITSADVFGFDTESDTIDRRILSTVQTLLSEPAQVVVLFSCDSKKVPGLSTDFLSLVLYSFAIKPLSEDDRHSFFSSHLKEDFAEYAARRTAGFVIAELVDLLKDVDYRIAMEKADSVEISHIEWAIDKRNSSFIDEIGAAKIPSVSWDDVGGFEHIKELIIESIEANLHGLGLRRSGIMLFGPPGCGKTLIAKAVATEFKIAFLSVKGPELLNMYVGQSEENVRNVFERARQASPCVVFFDEIDSLAPNRGRSGDGGGVMDRIVSQLITELDSLHDSPHIKVFVMAATNRADLIDPSLMTPGRFDKVIHVVPGADVESKLKILKAVTRKLKLAQDVDLRRVAEQCEGQWSGAELQSLATSAAMESIREQIALIEAGKITEADVEGIVYASHFQSALEKKLNENLKGLRRQTFDRQ
ncbi:hypothetical protein V3C99_015191 [Haemonchus contortus]